MNEKQRRLYHKATLEIMAKLERTAANQLKPMINRQFIDSAKLVEHGITDIGYVTHGQRERLSNILRNHYYRTANVAGRQATANFNPTKSMGESFWQEVDNYARTYAGIKVKTMLDTSTKVISNIIEKGVTEGMSHKEIAKTIRRQGNNLKNFMALRIARTETHGMYNAATEASVRDTGYRFKRIWSTTKDARTRRRKKGSIWDHWNVDGQERDQETPFDVSFQKLNFPGDTSLGASAENIINCRCVLLYEME